MRLRKEAYLVLAVIAILILFFVFRPNRGPKVEPTNLEGISIVNKSGDSYIQFDEGTKIALPNPPGIFLIANGSIVKDSDIRAIDGSSMIPMEILKDVVGGELEASETDGDEYTIKTKDVKIVFRLNQENIEVNDKASFIEVAPKREGRKTYVPLKAMLTYFGYKIDYTDGININKSLYPILPGYQQIFVHKYPGKIEPMNEEAAIKELKKQIKKETKSEPEKVDLVGENDRYFVFRLNSLAYVDKYSKNIYVLEKNDGILKFNLLNSKK